MLTKHPPSLCVTVNASTNLIFLSSYILGLEVHTYSTSGFREGKNSLQSPFILFYEQHVCIYYMCKILRLTHISSS